MYARLVVLQLFFLLGAFWPPSQSLCDNLKYLDDIIPQFDNSEGLSQGQREEIQNYQKEIAQKMRKMLFSCVQRKQGAASAETDKVLNEWPGLWQNCLPAGEDTLETQKIAGEKAVSLYCQKQLAPRFCAGFGKFEEYCLDQLYDGCAGGYTGRPGFKEH